MKHRHLRTLVGALIAGSTFVAAPVPAQGQEYPVKPIRFIVPFGPGGGNDILARAVAPRMAESLGQPVIVDNRPGAGGNIGTDMAAKAPADGYTMLIASN